MSWIGPAAKNGARIAVKYGPQAKIAFEKVGKPAGEAALRRAQAERMRRKAFAKAVTVIDGSVLRQMHAGEPVWVVLAGDEPVEAFPPIDISLVTLLKDADLSKVVTSEEFEAKRVKARVARARRTPIE